MVEAVIVDAVRSPIGRGKPTGALADVHAVDLLAQVLSALVARNGIDPARINDVIVGCVTQVGEQSANVGRQAVLAAGFPEHVPSVTVERKCGSGQQAIDFAVQGVQAGAYDIVIAAGIESMSRVPMGSGRMGADAHGPGVTKRYPLLVPQGVSAELVAHKWGISREQLDEYSARSHARAAAARDEGWFTDELAPIRTPAGAVVDRDETIRDTTTAEGLLALKPAFASDQYKATFPEIDWRVTAGNSSQIADGASALLIMSDRICAQLGLEPLARVVASSVIGDDPLLMLTGPIPATSMVLEKSGLSLEDLSFFEINEAFASVPLAWHAEFPVEEAALNPLGGAVALGHPLGASGARIATTLLHHMARTKSRYGLQSMCEAGGMANATIFESLR